MSRWAGARRRCLLTVRRYRCDGCGHVWRQATSSAAVSRAKLSRRGLRWALEGIVLGHRTVARVAEGPRCPGTPPTRVLAEGKRVLIEDPGRAARRSWYSRAAALRRLFSMKRGDAAVTPVA